MTQNIIPEMIDQEVTMRFIGDGSHSGTNFYWCERQNSFIVINLDSLEVSRHDKLFLVSCSGDPEQGLQQESLGCDLEHPNGLWLINSELVNLCEEWEDDYLIDVREVPKSK